MRKFIDIIGKPLLEAKNDKPTKTKTSYEFINSLDTGKKDVSSAKKKDIGLKATDLKTAGGEKTRMKSSGVRMHPGASAALSDMIANADEDIISDADAARNAGFDDRLRLGHERVTNENLPAIVNRDIEEAGYNNQPEWHQIKHLPGYMLNAIRAGGRKVFAEFTDTPLEEIQMICTFMNPEQDVRTVMSWVKANGVLADTATMTFGGGVQADVHKYVTDNMTFLLTSDFMGKYVYAWANNDRRLKSEPLKIAGPSK